MFGILTGSFKYLKRNQVKLHDNVLKLMQDHAEEKKEREKLMNLVMELRDEISLLVRVYLSET